eukprot:2242102-Pyramimonas_sp.AAC.1
MGPAKEGPSLLPFTRASSMSSAVRFSSAAPSLPPAAAAPGTSGSNGGSMLCVNTTSSVQYNYKRSLIRVKQRRPHQRRSPRQQAPSSGPNGGSCSAPNVFVITSVN